MLIRNLSVSCLAILVTVPLASSVRAQVSPTLNPSGATADPDPPPAEAPPIREQPIIVNVPGPAGSAPQGAAPEADTGFYYNDDLDVGPRTSLQGNRGPVPETHVVRSGDTLWDLCGFYFNNPWEWPRVWAYNPTITNPHWIYPGDLVRLYAANAGRIKPAASPSDPDPVAVSARAPVSRRGFRLRNLAFVDADKLKDAMTVDGAVQDKLMMSLGDDIYVRYSEKYKPKAGNKYSIYDEVEKVVHPRTGKVVGAYVRIRGEVEVRSVKKDRRARAVILRSSKPIERGQKVGPIKRFFKNIEPVRNQRSAKGFIVGKIGSGELIGARQLVLIDLGEKAGIKEGNRMFIVRRGDAYPELTDPVRGVGQDDKRFPARALGEILVVDVGKTISLAMVTLVAREVGVGDMVLMRKDAK